MIEPKIQERSPNKMFKYFAQVSFVLTVSCSLLALPHLARGADQEAASRPVPQTTKHLSMDTALKRQDQITEQRIPDYIRDLRLQLAGHIALGTGFGAALVGITLIEVDSWGDIGKAGFITACAGTGVAIAGMFLAGFSHPVHLRKKR